MSKQNKILGAIIAVLAIGSLSVWAFNRPEEPTAPLAQTTFTPQDTPSPQTPSKATQTAPTATTTTEEPTPPPVIPTPIPETPKPVSIALVDHQVPFTSQAPTGNWSDERQQDGCEEASALMAMLWVKGNTTTTTKAEAEITGISDFELEKYGEFRDVSLTDVQKWIFRDYFNYSKTSIKMDPSAEDIIKELEAGHIILAPMNGRKLGNPYFSGAGPERHMIVIRGYDPASKQFITNDPGTKRGQAYRYKEATIMSALLAYPTGSHVPIDGEPKGILIVSK